MTALSLSDAVIKLLVASLTDLGGRVYVSLIPQDASLPAAVVDVSSDMTLCWAMDGRRYRTRLGFRSPYGRGRGGRGHRYRLTRCLATLETLTGRNSSAAALEVEGYDRVGCGRGNCPDVCDE